MDSIAPPASGKWTARPLCETIFAVVKTGRTTKRQGRTRIRGWIGRPICAAIAVTAAVYSVAGAVSLVRDQSAQSTYDKAPYCAAATDQTQNCVLRTTADVGYVDVSKNTGKNAHGYTTSVYLEPQVGRSQTVVLSASRDLSGSVGIDDQLPVLVWRDRITRFTFSHQTHDADANPHHIVADELAQVALCLIAAAVFGRPLIRRLLRQRIAVNPERNGIADWTLAALVLATSIAALLRASYAVVVLGLAGVAVLVLSAVWPFAHPSPTTARYTAAVKNRKPPRAPGR